MAMTAPVGIDRERPRRVRRVEFPLCSSNPSRAALLMHSSFIPVWISIAGMHGVAGSFWPFGVICLVFCVATVVGVAHENVRRTSSSPSRSNQL